MPAVAIWSDFGAQENKICHCFRCFPIYLPWNDGIGCHDLRFFFKFSFKPAFSSFTFISSVQFSHSVISDSVRPHELQHTRPPCPSPTPRVHPNPCPMSWWCHSTILSSVIPFSSCPQTFPASGSFLMSQFFASNGQSIRDSALVLSMNIQDWFPLGVTDLISLLSKGLSRVFSSITVQKHQFSCAQPSLWFNSQIHTRLLEKPLLWLDTSLLAK